VIVLRRIVETVPVVLGITLYAFVILQLSPVNPAYAALGIYASPAQRAAFAREFHLNLPIWRRYPDYLYDLLRGNLGINVQGERVTSLLHQAFPVTLSIAVSAIVVALLIAYALGISSGYFAGTWWDNLTRVFAFGGLSVAQFWLGLLLIEGFAIHQHIFPAGGYVSPTSSITGWVRCLILPAATLAIPIGCYLSRIVRNAVIEELNQPYVRMARGCGLSERRVIASHVLRNASVAPVTVAGIQIGYVLSGAVVVEVIFNMHGVGFLLWTSAQQGDSAVTIGVALLSALVFVGVNLLADLLGYVLSPRTRTSNA
jgi:peptide/nickel transport system permease protein